MVGASESQSAWSPEGETLNLHQILAMVRRRKLSIALGFLMSAIPAVLLVSRMPNSYEATAKVSIHGTPQVMQLGPDYMPDQPGWRASDPIVALAASDAVLGLVADRLPQGSPGTDSLLDQLALRLGLRDERPVLSSAQERQQRIAWIRRSTSLELKGGGTVLEIKALVGSSDAAAAVANAVANAFVRYKLSEREEALRRASAWLGQRVLEVRGQIEQAENTLTDLAAREGIPLLETNEPNGDPRASLVSQLRTTEIELLITRQQLAELEPSVAQRTSRGLDEDRELLLEEYAESRAALERAQLTYTAAHPELVRLQRLVADLEKRLESRSAADTGREDDSVARFGALRDEEVRLEARVDVLERALDEQAAEGEPTSQARMAFDRLQRELAINREMLGILLRRRNETMLAAATESPDASVLDPAVPPPAPVGPNRLKWLVVGIGFALAVGGGLGLLRELLDRRVHDPDQVAELLGLQVLGIIPTVRGAGAPEFQAKAPNPSQAAESYRLLRTTLLFSQRGSTERKELGTLVVTSGVAGEGKTTISTNLAQTFASAGRKVLLIDGDMRRPRVHSVLGLERSPGLAELLRDSLPLKALVHKPEGIDIEVLTSCGFPEGCSQRSCGSPETLRWGLHAQAAMGSFFVVVAQPLGQCLGALVRGAVGTCIRPAAEHRTDEALGLAVGLRPIGPSAQVPDLVSLERLTEAAGDVAGTVVGEHPFDPDPASGKPAPSAFEEGRSGVSLLVRQDLDVG